MEGITMAKELSDIELETYSRQIVLADIGYDGQVKLRNAKGLVVNRTEGIASVGSAAMNNEECYVYQKFLRALGLVFIEHQARI